MVDKEQVLKDHKFRRGKIEIIGNVEMETKEQLSTYYTPGVAYPCLVIKDNPDAVYDYTMKGRTAAIVTDGTRILGLGKIGAAAGLPVMEGKALLLKKYAAVDAFPICINTTDEDRIVETVKNISPGFGIINIEDIEVPKCFAVTERLRKELDIPVFHDDRNGVGVVTLAALINALKLAGKRMNGIKVVINGAGAAGTGIAEILHDAGVQRMYMVDTVGILYKGRQEKMNPMKEWLAEITNKEQLKGDLASVVKGADVLIGASSKGAFTKEMVSSMAEKPIVFALANPEPEIPYRDALDAGAFIVATGRSDTPNQVNNSLAFPGVMRGLLEARAKGCSQKMLTRAARTIARFVGKQLSTEYIVPNPVDKKVIMNLSAKIAAEIVEAAKEEGLARVNVSGDEVQKRVKESLKRYRKVEKLAAKL